MNTHSTHEHSQHTTHRTTSPAHNVGKIHHMVAHSYSQLTPQSGRCESWRHVFCPPWAAYQGQVHMPTQHRRCSQHNLEGCYSFCCGRSGKVGKVRHQSIIFLLSKYDCKIMLLWIKYLSTSTWNSYRLYTSRHSATVMFSQLVTLSGA